MYAPAKSFSTNNALPSPLSCSVASLHGMMKLKEEFGWSATIELVATWFTSSGTCFELLFCRSTRCRSTFKFATGLPFAVVRRLPRLRMSHLWSCRLPEQLNSLHPSFTSSLTVAARFRLRGPYTSRNFADHSTAKNDEEYNVSRQTARLGISSRTFRSQIVSQNRRACPCCQWILPVPVYPSSSASSHGCRSGPQGGH